MKWLAQFIMRGYSQAALVAAVTALLALLIPLFGLISAASIGLMTLRGGYRQGLAVMLAATLGAGFFAMLVLGSPWLAVGILSVLWLPVWMLASLLRFSRSMTLTVQFAAMLGIVLIWVFHAQVADPVTYWLALLEPMRQTLITDGVVQAETSQLIFHAMAQWMTGSFVAALLFQLLMSLFIARWWQAILYNPGGFGDEFRSFRMQRIAGVPILLLMVWFGINQGSGIIADMLLVLGIPLVLQGFAVVHGVRQIMGARALWMLGWYLLFVFFMPQALVLAACTGLADIWLDIRARVGQRVKDRR